MPKTKNLGLNLTDDLNNKFSDWRKSIDGNDETSKSNMQIIDDAIGDLLNGSSGSGASGQYYQHKIIFSVSPGVVCYGQFLLLTNQPEAFTIDTIVAYFKNNLNIESDLYGFIVPLCDAYLNLSFGMINPLDFSVSGYVISSSTLSQFNKKTVNFFIDQVFEV